MRATMRTVQVADDHFGSSRECSRLNPDRRCLEGDVAPEFSLLLYEGVTSRSLLRSLMIANLERGAAWGQGGAPLRAPGRCGPCMCLELNAALGPANG